MLSKDEFLDVNNFKEVPLTINRVGVRTQDDGTVVLMPPEVLEEAASFIDEPIKDTHIGENVGVIQEAVFDGVFTRGTARLWDNYEDDGAREISPGFRCLYKNETGIWKDELGLVGEIGSLHRYTKVATRAIPNHAAIVEKGRNGETVRFELDDGSIIFNENKDNSMPRAKSEPTSETPKAPESNDNLSTPEATTATPTPEATTEPVVTPVIVGEDTTPTESTIAVELPPEVELTSMQLLEALRKHLEIDAKPKEMVWDSESVKKRLKKVQKASNYGLQMKDSELMLDDASFDAALLNYLGYETDSALDPYTIMSIKKETKTVVEPTVEMKTEEDSLTFTVSEESAQPTLNKKVYRNSTGGLVVR